MTNEDLQKKIVEYGEYLGDMAAEPPWFGGSPDPERLQREVKEQAYTAAFDRFRELFSDVPGMEGIIQNYLMAKGMTHARMK